jgi:hypothetical protein
VRLPFGVLCCRDYLVRYVPLVGMPAKVEAIGELLTRAGRVSIFETDKVCHYVHSLLW